MTEHQSSNRNCKNFKATYRRLTMAALPQWRRRTTIRASQSSQILQILSSLSFVIYYYTL